MSVAITKRFKEALTYSHTLTSRVEIHHGGEIVATLDKVTGGYVTIKRDDEARRTAYITATDDTGSITPDGTVNSIINLYDCMMKLYRGIRFPDGSVEEISLGLFPVSGIEMAESGQGMYLKVSGSDLSRKIARAKLSAPYLIPDGANAVETIVALINTRVSGIEFGVVNPTTHILPTLVYGVGSNPWEIATNLAASIGYDLFFDNEGQCTLQQAPDLSVEEVDWEFVEGPACTMLSGQKYYDDDEGYNWIVASSENASTVPIKAEAMDLNPASPTYVHGPYGIVVKTIASSDIKTQAQAEAVVARELGLVLGRTEMLYLVTVPNPALDIDDICYVKRGKAKTDGYYIVDQQTIPLTAEAAANVGIRKRISPQA